MSIKSIISNNKQLLIALILSIGIKIFSQFPDWVENFYIPYVFQPLAKIQRIIFGWLPVSFGDIIYLLMILLLFYGTFQLIQQIRKRLLHQSILQQYLKKTVTLLLYLYIIFHLLWGMNYSRKGIGNQLGLKVEKTRKTDIQNILSVIVEKLNNYSDSIILESKFSATLQKDAINCYTAVQKQYSFLAYGNQSIKETLFGRLLNYMGLLGYYNPFTGEAQINKTLPKFMLPNIIVHEIAHQIGYAKEDEANFVGYLTAKASNNSYFKYSAYFDLFQYAAMELNRQDTNAIKPFIIKLHPKVVSHLNEWKKFRIDHQSFLSVATMWIFNNYLKANHQKEGVDSYNNVISLLIAYANKFGLAAI